MVKKKQTMAFSERALTQRLLRVLACANVSTLRSLCKQILSRAHDTCNPADVAFLDSYCLADLCFFLSDMVFRVQPNCRGRPQRVCCSKMGRGRITKPLPAPLYLHPKRVQRCSSRAKRAQF